MAAFASALCARRLITVVLYSFRMDSGTFVKWVHSIEVNCLTSYSVGGKAEQLPHKMLHSFALYVLLVFCLTSSCQRVVTHFSVFSSLLSFLHVLLSSNLFYSSSSFTHFILSVVVCLCVCHCKCSLVRLMAVLFTLYFEFYTCGMSVACIHLDKNMFLLLSLLCVSLWCCFKYFNCFLYYDGSDW